MECCKKDNRIGRCDEGGHWGARNEEGSDLRVEGRVGEDGSELADVNGRMLARCSPLLPQR